MYFSQKVIDSSNVAELHSDMQFYTRVSTLCFIAIFELKKNKIKGKYRKLSELKLIFIFVS